MIKEFTIDRKAWLRGNNGFGSQLLNHKGERCCVGFLAREIGIPDRKLDKAYLHDVKFPEQEEYKFIKLKLGSSFEETPDNSCIYTINDDTTVSEKRREKLITEFFAHHGIRVNFIN